MSIVLRQLISKVKENRGINQSELKSLDMDGLLELKMAVDEDLAQVSCQLDLAKAKASSTGQYSDPDWFSRATMAKRIKGLLSPNESRTNSEKSVGRGQIPIAKKEIRPF